MIDTTTAQVFMLNDDVMVIKFKSDVLVMREDAVKIIEAQIEASENKPSYVIVDALDISSNMHTDAQKYMAHESPYIPNTIAAAILLNNLAIRLTAGIFMKFQKPPFPTKVFGDQEAAIKWFDSLRKEA